MTTTIQLPSRDEMWAAFVSRDASYDGVFYTGVTTTGIFCRPTCSARKPKRENVTFHATAADALYDGYRPCLRCRPTKAAGETPAWIRPLLERLDAEPERRRKAADLRALELDPDRVRRWFQRTHGVTFHRWQRARRVGRALGHIRNGGDVTQAAYDNGFDSLSGFYDAFRDIVGESPARSRDATPLHVTRIATPLGAMLAAATDDALVLLEFTDRRMLETQLRRLSKALEFTPVPGDNTILEATRAQLDEYFAGERLTFDLPLLTPGSAFQRDVWRALCAIPYGETRSYGEQARMIERPDAVRAVARANGDNRIAIVIPCHRVIGADGKLTGYGGGMWRKQRLLELERGARGLFD